MKKILLILLALGLSYTAGAQKFSLSTNLVDWASLGTINLEGGMSLSRHFSLTAGGHYNPWEFQTRNGYDMYSKQTAAYVGARYWLWYVYSGWWAGAKVQYASYSSTGIWRPALEDRQSIGAGLSFGYTLMMHKNLNIEFGAGFWAGRHFRYTLYECPKCMRVRASGGRGFILPDDISVSVMYVF